MTGLSSPAMDLVGYAAFVRLHHHGYEMYAHARLGDGFLAVRVVAQVLCWVELCWGVMLLGDPAAFTWRMLRDAVTVARTGARDSRADRLHRALPDRPADAVLLREGLGLAPRAAAALMGLDEPELYVQLKAAHRMLAGLGVARGAHGLGCGPGSGRGGGWGRGGGA
ncbi:hypothetical protein ACFQ6N_04195 [Kitasatospora sp. NPDC056446]|uniref:hypothetical protein n=1 Tax=Kitasatospora sp. NPDC056446 TaxID=3345819 RepID=UPI003673D17E